MASQHEKDEEEYNSSSDEDYDPSKDTEHNQQDEIDDAEDGEEVADEDVEYLQKDSKSQKKEENSEESSTTNGDDVDVDAIFAALTGQAPPVSTASSSSSSNSKTEIKVPHATEPSSSSSSEVKESPKVYPRTTEISEKGDVGTSSAGKKRVGLLDAAKALTKRSKMSVLEKSDQDWKDFTRQNNLKEDLESHNRGKGGYLNKMEFLNRTDNRQFEKERAFRASARKDTN
ncbi:hypothetical protein GCK72_002553 [Caenorhabditis remanei]|uniref:Uncharacterized protein n=1 Tax=Caenorhabditis remanei TaxID=31234 RepID=A0A2P4V9A7_CAERE|nr:hypothetical protein GCK72_002553 [Caenorhabditis remanei]KAF1770730.1 hypothetical protein GCK72_002553 [Caenorhabditis remanei]